MYYLTTRAIEHPETLEVIVPRMIVLSIDDVRMLVGKHGIDSIHCVICTDMRAVEAVTKDMMDGKF